MMNLLQAWFDVVLQEFRSFLFICNHYKEYMKSKNSVTSIKFRRSLFSFIHSNSFALSLATFYSLIDFYTPKL